VKYGDLVPVGLGWATVLPEFDWETYSEAGYAWNDAEQKWESLPGLSDQNRGLSAVGVYNYVQHPTFEVLSLSYNLKDGYGPRFWTPPADLRPFVWDGIGPPSDLVNFGADPRHPWPLIDHVARLLLIEAWNEEFEHVVWNLYCCIKWGWPALSHEQARCAMAKASASCYPRALDNVAIPLKLPVEFWKDEAGKPLIRKLTVPKKPTKRDPSLRYTRESAPEDFAKFDAYNVQDIITESEASIRIPDLVPRELDAWQVNQAINRRGMHIDVVGVANCITIVEQCIQQYTAELKEITGGRVESHSEVAKTIEWAKLYGAYLPNLDEDTIEEQLKVAHPAAVLRVLKIRQMLSFGSVKKLYAMRAQTCRDHRLRGQYAYHAQITGHPSGQGVQVANLYKGKLNSVAEVERALSIIACGSLDYVEGVYGDALETVANCLRSMIVAAPGHRLIASDYTAIQAVVTAALAGEEWRLEVFRTHGKIYEMCASMITGKPFQFYLDYKKQTGKHHEDRQPYGKIPELSAGFGSWITGWKKFGADEFMSDAEIKEAILKWRAASPWIVELWGGQTRNKFGRDINGNRAREYEQLYGLEGAAIAAVKYPGQAFGYRGIRYQMHGDALYCQPPGNGAPIVYHEPRLAPASRDWASPWELELSYMGWNSNQTKGKGGWVRMFLYGGVLTQNVVAKVSREFQTDSLSRCEHSGLYLPVMQTYDEIVTEVPIGRGSVEEYLKLVEARRDGCYDEQGRPWPIKVPGADETFRYGKWE
jgi:DNA polymerase